MGLTGWVGLMVLFRGGLLKVDLSGCDGWMGYVLYPILKCCWVDGLRMDKMGRWVLVDEIFLNGLTNKITLLDPYHYGCCLLLF